MIRPTFRREQELFAGGVTTVIGCDEVGRGCLAGPVVAAAVVMPTTLRRGWKSLVRDSKSLNRSQRKTAVRFIRAHAVSIAVGEVDVDTIDRVNIHHASLEAMRRAVLPLVCAGAAILVDGIFTIPRISVPQQSVVHGDAHCLAIAAASVVAKEYRDELMERMDIAFPQYGFAQHKGYATSQHRAAILTHGLTEHHRRSFCSFAAREGVENALHAA